MADYSKATNFSVKDTLSTGDPNKIVSGAEIDTEFDNIAVASGTKADKVSGATSGNVAQLDTNGNLVDSGLSSTDVSNVSGVITTEGDLMIGDASGDETRLGVGTSGEVLVSNGSTLSWTQVSTAGIANNSVTNAKVSGLGAENFQTGSTEESWVRGRIADSGVGEVGTYASLTKINNTAALNPGDTIAGSSLAYTSFGGGKGTSPGGTWRCMGLVQTGSLDGSDPARGTLFLRIS